MICAFCTFYYVSDVSKVSVLVPGAGLGRLAWEIARLGYICQGNEWSFFMLFSSNFVLNRYNTYWHSCDSSCLTQHVGTITFLSIHLCRISLLVWGGTVYKSHLILWECIFAHKCSQNITQLFGNTILTSYSATSIPPSVLIHVDFSIKVWTGELSDPVPLDPPV